MKQVDHDIRYLLRHNPLRLNDSQIAKLFLISRNRVVYLRRALNVKSAVGRGRPKLTCLAPKSDAWKNERRSLIEQIKKGKTQSEIAREIGVSRQRVNQIFNHYQIDQIDRKRYAAT